MKSLLLTLTLILAQQGTAPITAPPAVRGSIRGIVKQPNSGEAIADVEITLTTASQGNAPSPQTLVTDADGKFAFENLAAGRYVVRAQRTGYFPVNADLGLPGILQQNSSTVVISSDTPNAQSSIELVPGATISGRVRDVLGKPAVGIPIAVLRTAYQDGHKILSPVTAGALPGAGGQMTNDRGEYRVFWFPPGEYYIRTDGVQQNRTSASATTPLITYYPGTKDSTRAIPITLHPAEELTGIDFAIETAPAFKVSGKVKLLVPGGRVMPDGQLSRSISSFFVVPQNAEMTDRIPLSQNSVFNSDPAKVDLDFEVRGLSPGAYYLYPLFTDGQTGTNGTPIPTYFSTRIAVDVIDRDVTGLTAEIHRFPNVAFHITLKGDPPPNTPPQQLVPRIQLRIQEAMGNLISGGSASTPPPGPDGSVVFVNLFPAKYKILVPQPATYYVADIRQGATSFYNDGIITVTGEEQSSPVEIIMSTGGGQLQGVVHNKTGEPVAARVVLIPQAPLHLNSLLYKRAAAPATTGQFTLTAVAPGAYKIFAWESLPNGAEENAEFMQKYESLGKLVTVSAGVTNANLTLDLISSDLH